MQDPYNTPMPNIPPALASILSVGSPTVPPVNTLPDTGISSGMLSASTFIPSYKAGGMIGPGGSPDTSGVGMGGTGAGMGVQARV